jgi:hypothetical protein
MNLNGSNESFDEMSELLALLGLHAGAKVCDAMIMTSKCAPMEV